MKIRSPIRRRKARLEIIPLIDIMFFLLASFMMVSLQMQKVRTLKASLPTATLASSSEKPDLVDLRVDRLGLIHLDKTQISRAICSPSSPIASPATPTSPSASAGTATPATATPLLCWISSNRPASSAWRSP